MSEHGSPTVKDEWILANRTAHWQPACQIQRSRHFARYQPEPINGKPAVWEEDVRDGGKPVTGQRREFRG